MRTIILAALAASAVAAPAFAQTADSVEPTSAFTPVVAVSAGLGRFADGSEEFEGGSAIVRTSLRLHRNFGVEADGSFGLETSDIAGYDFKMKHTVAGYVVGYWPLADNVDLIGRVGYGESEFEISNGVASVSDAYSGVTAGVGAQYFFDEKNGLRMDVTRHHYEELGGGMDSVMFTYVRNF